MIAVVLLDNASWHKTKKLEWPANVRPLYIPPGCPELNSAENIWQYMRQTWLSNRVFAGYDAVVNAASDAWLKLKAETGRIASIASRGWAVATSAVVAATVPADPTALAGASATPP